MNSSTADYSPFDGHISLLRPATLAQLSHMLNPTKVLPTEDGHLRDWRGLAELFNLDVLTIQTLERSSNPFVGMIRKIPPDLPVYRLIQFLETLDRYDVLDDTIALMENDLHLASSQAISLEATKTDIPQIATIEDVDHLSETGTLQQYDAFVLYAPEDQAFVNQVVEKMEGEYGLKLCLKDRDLMAGLPFEHKAVTELISNRCRFVLPIFSPRFVDSEDNKFVVNFSEALGIERGHRKIVPCIYEQCNLPKTVCYYTKLDYTRQTQHWDFWEKMRKSLVDPTVQSNGKMESRKTSTSSMQELKSKAATYGLTTPTKEVPPPQFVSLPPVEALPSSEQVKEEPKTETKQFKHWLKKAIPKSKKKTKVKAVAC